MENINKVVQVPTFAYNMLNKMYQVLYTGLTPYFLLEPLSGVYAVGNAKHSLKVNRYLILDKVRHICSLRENQK